jgi:uncharacterized protein YeaO (DUF488 family)
VTVVRTKSVKEPVEPGDGTRVLITRFRPRGVRKGAESWVAWDKRLAPSLALFDAYRGRSRAPGRRVVTGLEPIAWEEFTRRFDDELRAPAAREALAEYRTRAEAGETITLLCYCDDAARCHRGLVQRSLT